MEMEQALEFRRQVGSVLPDEIERDKLYRLLQGYHESRLSVQSLAKKCKQLINSPERLSLFESLRMVISDDDQVKFNEHIPRHRPTSIHTTTLNIGNEDQLGFSIRGGIEYGIGIYVVCVEPFSLADRNGIEKGDEILQVNKYPIHQCTHKEAVNLITANKKKLLLTVRHVGMVPEMKDNLLWKFADDKESEQVVFENNFVPENKEKDIRNELLQYQKEAVEREKRRAARSASSKSVDVKSPNHINNPQYQRATSDVFPLSQRNIIDLKEKRQPAVKTINFIKSHKVGKSEMQKNKIGILPIQEQVETKSDCEDLEETEKGCNHLHIFDEKESQAGKKQRKQSELEKRLICERLARLNQEKALKVSRLRQEAKEAEREENRLRCLLADDDDIYVGKELALPVKENKKFCLTAPTELIGGFSCPQHKSPTETTTHEYRDGICNRHEFNTTHIYDKKSEKESPKPNKKTKHHLQRQNAGKKKNDKRKKYGKHRLKRNSSSNESNNDADSSLNLSSTQRRCKRVIQRKNMMQENQTNYYENIDVPYKHFNITNIVHKSTLPCVQEENLASKNPLPETEKIVKKINLEIIRSTKLTPIKPLKDETNSNKAKVENTPSQDFLHELKSKFRERNLTNINCKNDNIKHKSSLFINKGKKSENKYRNFSFKQITEIDIDQIILE